MYSAAAICRSTHLPIPQEGRIITSDDVFGHLPDIRCINGGIDAAAEQIRSRQYAEPFKADKRRVVALAIELDDKGKGLIDWKEV